MRVYQVLLCSLLLLLIGVKAIASDQTVINKENTITKSTTSSNLFVNSITQDLKSNWFPPKNNEQVDIEFVITKSGQYKHLKIIKASSNEKDNQAAIDAVMFASPFDSIKNLHKEVRIKYTFPSLKI